MFEWLNSLDVIGGDIVAAVGTVFAAVLGAFTGVLTWFLTGRRETRKEREQRQRELDESRAERLRAIEDQKKLKEERIDDMVRALHAEIVTGVVLYEQEANPDRAQRVISDPNPFTTPDETDFVFNAIKEELSILPSDVIHAVVAYYRVAQQTNLIIRDFRDPVFRSQPPASKEEFLRGYFALNQILKHRGERAVRQLSRYASRRGFGEELDKAKDQITSDTREAMARASKLIGRSGQLLGRTKKAAGKSVSG